MKTQIVHLKKISFKLNLLTFLLALISQRVSAQSDEDIYNLVSSSIPSAYTIEKADKCRPERFFLKSLYLVDQQEAPLNKQVKITCNEFSQLMNPFMHFEFVFKNNFRTHSILKNLNLIVVDILNNGIFDDKTSALMVPWLFNASLQQVSLKNPIHSFPILLHEYAHYLIHNNSLILNYNYKEKTKLNLYFDSLHELLSDVFVVLFYNDPKIMMNALKSTFTMQYPDGKGSSDIMISESQNDGQKRKLYHYTLKSRDFDNTFNSLENIMSKFRNGDKYIAPGYFYAPHSLLAPIRKYLWDNMLSNPQILQESGGKSGLAVYLTSELGLFFKYLNTQHYPQNMKPQDVFEFINKELIIWIDRGLNLKKYKYRTSMPLRNINPYSR